MLHNLIKLGICSVRTPRAAAIQLLDAGLDRVSRYQFAALVVVLSGIASQILFTGSASDAEGSSFFMGTAFGTAILEAGMLAGTVLATHLFGRAFGGTGRMDDAVLLVAWLQLISLVVQLGLLLLFELGGGLIGPGNSVARGAAVGATILSIGYLLWVYANFVTVLHSFESALKVLLGVILTAMALAVGIATLATSLLIL